ncbi:MAG: acyl-CoA thioesterase [Bacteroidetes bacterium]|nr:acyl-CoA thioesterase [Bacteroidota bacterium]
MFTAATNIRVKYAETDQMGVVYHGHYAAYFEAARGEAIRSLGITYRDIENNGILMPVVELDIKFLRPAHYDDLLKVVTILKEWPSDHRIRFHHEVYNEAGKLLTTGSVLLYFINAADKAKTKMPDLLATQLKNAFPSIINS